MGNELGQRMVAHAFDENNGIHEEVIGYLCTAIGDLSNTEASRGTPK
ncbi:hypothetical protein [Mucilaginibacter sp.]